MNMGDLHRSAHEFSNGPSVGSQLVEVRSYMNFRMVQEQYVYVSLLSYFNPRYIAG